MRHDERERQAAESARYRLNIRPGKRVDVFGAITELRIRLLRYPAPDRGSILGAYKRIGDEAFIFVSSSAWPVRQRFTAAHELGHHWLELGGGEASHFDTDRGMWADTDRPANWFAGHFLMDESGLKNLAVGSPTEAALRTAAHYEVSIDTAAMQLEVIGLITKAEADAVVTERKRYALLADLYAAHHLVPPRATMPDRVIQPDRYYRQRAQRLLERGLIDQRRFDEIMLAGTLSA